MATLLCKILNLTDNRNIGTYCVEKTIIKNLCYIFIFIPPFLKASRLFVYMRASMYNAAEHCQPHTKMSSRMPPDIQTSDIVYSRIYAPCFYHG